MIADFAKLTTLHQSHLRDGAESDSALVAAVRTYLLSQSWCGAIGAVYRGLAIPHVLGVYLVAIEPRIAHVDRWLWVIVGDAPSAHVVTDECVLPSQALEVYCGLMDDWVKHIGDKDNPAHVFPVAAARTPTNAQLLASRLEFIRSRILPELHRHESSSVRGGLLSD